MKWFRRTRGGKFLVEELPAGVACTYIDITFAIYVPWFQSFPRYICIYIFAHETSAARTACWHTVGIVIEKRRKHASAITMFYIKLIFFFVSKHPHYQTFFGKQRHYTQSDK